MKIIIYSQQLLQQTHMISQIQACLIHFKAILQRHFNIESKREISALIGQITFKDLAKRKFIKTLEEPKRQYKNFHRLWADWQIIWTLKPIINSEPPHSLKLQFWIADNNMTPYLLPNFGMKIQHKINQLNKNYHFLRVILMENSQIILKLRIDVNLLIDQNLTIKIIRLLFGQAQKALFNDLPSIFQFQQTHFDNLKQWYNHKKVNKQHPSIILTQKELKVYQKVQISKNMIQNPELFQQKLHNHQIEKFNQYQQIKNKEQIKVYTVIKDQGHICKILKKIKLQSTLFRELIMNIKAFGTINIDVFQPQIYEFESIDIIQKSTCSQESQQIFNEIKAIASLSGTKKIIRMPKYFLVKDDRQGYLPVILVEKGQQNFYQVIKKLHQENLFIQCLKYYLLSIQILIELQSKCLIHRDFRPQNIVKFPNKKLCAIDFAGLTQSFRQDANNIGSYDYIRINQKIRSTSVFLLPKMFLQTEYVNGKLQERKKQFTQKQFQKNKKQILYELYHPNFDMFAAGILLENILIYLKKHEQAFIPENMNITQKAFYAYLRQIKSKCKEKGDQRFSAIQIHYVIQEIINCVHIQSYEYQQNPMKQL